MNNSMKWGLLALLSPVLVACFPLNDSGDGLNRNNAGDAGNATGKSTEIGDELRSDIEDSIENYSGSTTGVVSVPIDVCGESEPTLQLDVQFDTPTGKNTAELTATADCTYQRNDNSEVVIKQGSNINYIGSSTTDMSENPWVTTGEFIVGYDFEVETTAGAQISGARDLEVEGSHTTEVFWEGINITSIESTSVNSASGEVYAPKLGQWLELSTQTDIVANYELNFTTPSNSFFNRSAGVHRLEDENGNNVTVSYRVDGDSKTQYIDYILNNGAFDWTISYSY